MNRLLLLAAIVYSLVTPAAAWIHGAPSGSVPGGPGLVVGTYGSTTGSGWTTIGPSDGTLASASFTNIIYVSDSLGSDLRDGSTPTFVDDGVTEQCALSSTQSPVAGDTYHSPNMAEFTVAISVTSQTTVQFTSRTGTPDVSGTLTKDTGSGPATMAYTGCVPGIHGPVKTLIKGAGGTGPGLYDPNNTGSSSVFNGDGTGLGTIGNWHTAGAGNGFAMRAGKPDWLLLRMGDTFVNQCIERGFSAGGGTDNFGIGGFSEQEPMVVSSYDEAVPATSPDLPSGARARPIVLVPGATVAYATMQGDVHAYEGRAGISLQGAANYIVVMGIDFYSAQRDPGNATYYVMAANVENQTTGVSIPGGTTGTLVEDIRVRWATNGVGNNDPNIIPTTFDLNLRRNEIGPCYTTGGGNVGIGFVIDATGAIGGAISPGFTFEENVIDQCGYVGAALTVGDSHIRNVYIQYTAIFGNRRGNTSTRSGSEDFQFRSGGVIDDNFTWGGIVGYDVGHAEGDPALTSSTVVTNNIMMNPLEPFATTDAGFNFANSNNGTATGNILADANSALAAPPKYAVTDSYTGDINNLSISNPGSGGVNGKYSCIGGVGTLTGGTGSGTTSTYYITVSGGVLTDWSLLEATTGGTYLVGDVLTPIANYPSINNSGVSLSAAGSGGTPGSYGATFNGAGPFCFDPDNAGLGIIDGVALTNFSGSMAGSGARAWFTIGGGGTVTAFGIVNTGNSYQVGDVLTASFGGISGVRITVNSVAHLSGWTVTVASTKSSGVHGLSFTNNIVFNWAGQNPPLLDDTGGTHDSPGGVPGSGAANVWTPNSFCIGAQFTGAISLGTVLTTSAVVNGPIAAGNLAGPGVVANTTIVSGSGSSWVISPTQSNISAETMYSYTCTPTVVYAHPERTIETYAASLGLTASIDGYMYGNGTTTGALNTGKWSGNTAYATYTANNGINPYIRLGFQ